MSVSALAVVLLSVFIPVVMIIAGWAMQKHCPKKINYFFGYRTPRSMKSQETWVFAHEHAGKLWGKAGWLILIPSLLVSALCVSYGDGDLFDYAGFLCIAQVICMLACVLATESALKKNFTDDGRPRY